MTPPIEHYPLRKRIVEVALSQVGIREEGLNNCGPAIRKYQEATWLAPGAWPWCAAFTAWVLREALKSGKYSVKPCLDASAFGWEKWGRANGAEILPETALACSGDFVIFDFSHIGVVVRDQKAHDSVIHTVEGNVSTKAGATNDSPTGDGVWMKQRAISLTKCYVRI